MISRPIWYSSERLSMALALLPRSGSEACTGLGVMIGAPAGDSCARAPVDSTIAALSSRASRREKRLIAPSHHRPARVGPLIFRVAALEDLGGLVGQPGALTAPQ